MTKATTEPTDAGAKKRPRKKKGPSRFRRPMTPIQRERSKLLIDLDLNQTEIAVELGVSRQAINGLFLDRNRSMGPGGLEQRIVKLLNKHSPDRTITLDDLGWGQW